MLQGNVIDMKNSWKIKENTIWQQAEVEIDKRYKEKKNNRARSRQANDSRSEVSFAVDPDYKQISNKTKKMDLRATPSKRSSATCCF